MPKSHVYFAEVTKDGNVEKWTMGQNEKGEIVAKAGDQEFVIYDIPGEGGKITMPYPASVDGGNQKMVTYITDMTEPDPNSYPKKMRKVKTMFSSKTFKSN